MRQFFAALSLLAAAIFTSYFISCNNKGSSSTSAEQAKEDSVKQVIARGEYLVTKVAPCLDCHSKRDWTKYSGPVTPGTEGMGGEEFSNKLIDDFPGVVYARNITSDPETGIGNWTDDEVLRAITQGISKNGDTLFPLMPYANFNRMAKSDLQAIIAYIRTLKPIKNKVPQRHLMIPASLTYPPNLQKSVDGNMMPPESDRAKYGEYLVITADCFACHTPSIKGKRDMQHLFSGGNTFHLEKFTVTAANITPDSATGIGTWTEARFLDKFKPYRDEKGYSFDPGKQNTIMPVSFFAQMTDDDLKAIYAYLRTIPPVSHKVDKYPTK